MKEKPILFSTPMVQAILEGRKTMTRRILKEQLPEDAHNFHFLNDDEIWKKRKIENSWMYFIDPKAGSYPCDDKDHFNCRYGQPGDVLWVREATILNKNSNSYWPCADGYLKTAEYEKKVPSIHMPKAAARIWLQIEEIRVERLQDISEDNARREGVKFSPSIIGPCYFDYINGGYNAMTTAYHSFRSLWKKINGNNWNIGWDINPWVWVIEFKVLSTTGKPQLETLNLELKTVKQ